MDYDPAEGPDGATIPFREFLAKYQEDDNEWWRAASGHHQNLFEDACEEVKKLESELSRLQSRREDMGDKSRLCNVCGRWIRENEDLVLMREDMGSAHLECAWETKDNTPGDGCGNCHNCVTVGEPIGLPLTSLRMIVCPKCGNKRCPKATNHINECTNSNEPGQPGSVYTVPW